MAPIFISNYKTLSIASLCIPYNCASVSKRLSYNSCFTLFCYFTIIYFHNINVLIIYSTNVSMLKSIKHNTFGMFICYINPNSLIINKIWQYSPWVVRFSSKNYILNILHILQLGQKKAPFKWRFYSL